MTLSILETPNKWTWPLSVADLMKIESLDDETRAVVERYARRGGFAISDNPKDAAESDQWHDGYEKGWEDGCEEVIDSISAPSCPRRERRRKSDA